MFRIPLVAFLFFAVPASVLAQGRRPTAHPKLETYKEEAIRRVDSLYAFTQQINDMVFSFGELGFQETETSRYLVKTLREQGFTVEEGTSGMPTAWVARWGAGKPVIALGSDIDGIPQASQKPGVAYHEPLVPGAPGHGEGHNSGQAVNIGAALAVKAIMERDRIPGTLVLWPGVAEELVGAKAHFVRDGLFRDVDAALFSHVSDNFTTSWGEPGGTGLVSVEFSFAGQTAHSAGQPWRGRSALDAVELMNVGWNFRREHLRLQSRSHYVVVQGGDQPNVVPNHATVWYYLRETQYPRIQEMFGIADTMARAAAMMTGTSLASVRVLGSAWPQHMNRPMAEAMTANIRRVALPRWSADDQTLAKAIQKELGQTQRGLDTLLDSLTGTIPDDQKRGGGSDDIGDVSWAVPTITLRYPANIPSLPGHHWANAIAMATPIAHKGVNAGAKAMALMVLDLLLAPSLRDSAWAYYRNVQTKDQKYVSLLRAEDKPPVEMNTAVMAKYREQMRRFYYDPSRYGTYLEQLGVKYPTVR